MSWVPATITAILKSKIVRIVLRIVAYLIGLMAFAVTALILFVITAVAALNIFPPAYIFSFPNLLVFLLVPFVLAYAFHSLPARKSKKSDRPLSRKTMIVYLAAFVFICVLLVIIGEVRSHNEDVTLENARTHFQVSVNGIVSPGRVDSTLIELEAQLERLNGIYGLIDSQRGIVVLLYPNPDELRKANAAVPVWMSGSISYDSSGRPVIRLPAEQASGGSSRTNQFASPRPAHEITHLAIHEMLGADRFNRMPLWLSEGLADYESRSGFNNWIDSALLKPYLWLFNLGNPSILDNEGFILQPLQYQYPTENVDIFYLASWQFVQYMNKDYSTLSALKRVVNGDDFDSALKAETGKTAKQLYLEWKHYYFGG